MANLVNITNPVSQTGVFDTDAQSSFFLGGGANAKKIVSQEFSDIVSGSQLNADKIEALLDEILNGDGVDGVELTSLSRDSFTINLDANSGTTDTIVFQGAMVTQVIDGLDTGLVNIVNGQSGGNDFGIFNTDESKRFFLGGGKNAKGNLVSEEFETIVNGSKLHRNKVGALLEELVLGDGIENVDLLTLSSDSFTIQLNTTTGFKDTILIEGQVAKDAITGLSKDGINIPDAHNQLGIFQYDSSNNIDESFFLGGGANAKGLVSQDFDNLVAGSKLKESELEQIYLGARDGTIDNVELLFGNSSKNFTVALNVPSRGTQDIVTVIDTAVI